MEIVIQIILLHILPGMMVMNTWQHFLS